MKKYISILMALLPILASADAVKIGSIYYDLDSETKTAEVTSNPNEYTGEVVIPKTVTYHNIKYKVTSIGVSAFDHCRSLTSITIPNSVTSIGSCAFWCCSSLSSITIPNSVTSIGGSAFGNTPWFDNQSDGMVYAGKVAYKYKGEMSEGTKIRIKDGTLGIADYAFYNFSSLTSVTIPNSVTSIGSAAFYGCSSLTSVNIPNSVTSIGSAAFNDCSSLTSMIIPNSVTSIGGSAFCGCSCLTSVTIGNSLTSIGNSTFKGSGLTSIIIPNSITYIAFDAFKYCENLTTVVIGKGIRTICADAFENCTKLTDVYCLAENQPNASDYAFQDSNIRKATLHVPAGSIDVYKVTTPWSGFKDIVAIATVKVKLNKTKVTIEKSKTMTLKPTLTPLTFPDKSVTWKSSNTKVAMVTSTGNVKGIKAGTATITCTSVATGAKATCKVTVGYVKLDKTEAGIKKGKTLTLIPTVYPSSQTDKSVTWESSNMAVATVSSTGKVKGVKYGTATITCTSNATGLSATCQVTVGKLVISVSEVTLKRNRTSLLTPIIYPSSLSDKSVTWESSDTKIATVNSEGKVKGIKAGTATITCTSVATGLSGTCKVTVLSTTGSRSTETNGDDGVTGIEDLENTSALAEPYDVYDLSGRKVRHQVNSLDGLPEGIYIVNGKKILKKK